MAASPNSLIPVIVGIFVGQAIKCAQPYRGVCARTFTAWPETHFAALRIMNVSDVVGYSCAALIGGLLFEAGGFQACANFQFAVTAAQMLLTLRLPAITVVAHNRSVTPAAVSQNLEEVVNITAAAASTQSPKMSLRAAGTFGASNLTITAGAVSIFAYACELNTYALFFREVWGWGSTWTGFAQMAGDLLAGGALLVWVSRSSARSGSLPASLDGPRGVAAAFVLYAACFVLLAQDSFALALAGQLAMGSSYVLITELATHMLVVYSRGNPELYRRLLLYYELGYNAGVSIATVSIVIYVWHKQAPFWGCASLTGMFAAVFAAFFSRRFRGHGGLLSSLSFVEIEATLFRERVAPQAGFELGDLSR
jgi:hypothetical protein